MWHACLMILPFQEESAFLQVFSFSFLEYNYSIKSILTGTHYSPDNAESRWRRLHTHPKKAWNQ